MQTELREPVAECQREVVRALARLAHREGRQEGSIVETPLSGMLSEYQWDRCWWNARWWARNEEPTAYELFRLAGRGCPIALDRYGNARIELGAAYPDRVAGVFQAREGRAKRAVGPAFRESPEPGSGTVATEVSGIEPREEKAMLEAPSTDLRLRAIRFVQNDRVFYTTVVPAASIIERSRVDVWSADVPQDEAGYQRAPMAARLRDIANYVAGSEAILPAGGLLNARSTNESEYGQVLEFEPDEEQTGAIQSGWLTVPESSVPLFIVDMQHRLLGVERAIWEDGRDDLADFPLVVTIADGLSKLEEIEQFELINTTQKKVRTDLARRLMSIQVSDPDVALRYDQRGRKWEARGPKIADWLNHNSDVWTNSIMPPNKTKKDMPTALTKETSFVTSLKPILQTPLFQRTEDEQVAVLIDRYWQAVRSTWPEAFKRPADHVIHRTSGVFSLHQLMPEVVELARADGSDMSVDRLTEIMRPWQEQLGEDYWARDREDGAARYGTSMGAFSRLAAELRRCLPPLDLGL